MFEGVSAEGATGFGVFSILLYLRSPEPRSLRSLSGASPEKRSNHKGLVFRKGGRGEYFLPSILLVCHDAFEWEKEEKEKSGRAMGRRGRQKGGGRG